MDHPAIIILPVLFPVGRQLLRCRDVAYRGIEPYIQHLAFSTLHRHRHPPVQVTAHRPGLQPLVDPRFALSVHIGLPLLVILEDPLLEPRLVPVQRKVPVFGLLQLRLAPAEPGGGIDQIGRTQRRATLFTLVAVGPRVVAVRTCAGNVAVGQKGIRLRIEILVRGLLQQLPFVEQFFEYFRGRVVMHLVGGARIYIESNAKIFESLLIDRMVPVDDILRTHPLTTCLQGYGNAMLIRSADMDNVLSAQPLVTGINIGRHIHTGQVTQVEGAVGIGECRGNEVSFVIFHLCKGIL